VSVRKTLKVQDKQTREEFMNGMTSQVSHEEQKHREGNTAKEWHDHSQQQPKPNHAASVCRESFMRNEKESNDQRRKVEVKESRRTI
jgi:hypothetical protein